MVITLIRNSDGRTGDGRTLCLLYYLEQEQVLYSKIIKENTLLQSIQKKIAMV